MPILALTILEPFCKASRTASLPGVPVLALTPAERERAARLSGRVPSWPGSGSSSLASTIVPGFANPSSANVGQRAYRPVKPVDFAKFTKLMESFGFYWLMWNQYPT